MRGKIGIGLLCAAMAVSMAVAQSTKQPAYDVKKEVTLTGKVVNVKTIPDWMGTDGLNIAIEGDDAKQINHVDVATASFLKLLDFPIAVGDEVRLLGVLGESADGSPVFLVHEIKNKRVTLDVRDMAGKPLW